MVHLLLGDLLPSNTPSLPLYICLFLLSHLPHLPIGFFPLVFIHAQSLHLKTEKNPCTPFPCGTHSPSFPGRSLKQCSVLISILSLLVELDSITPQKLLWLKSPVTFWHLNPLGTTEFFFSFISQQHWTLLSTVSGNPLIVWFPASLLSSSPSASLLFPGVCLGALLFVLLVNISSLPFLCCGAVHSLGLFPTKGLEPRNDLSLLCHQFHFLPLAPTGLCKEWLPSAQTQWPVLKHHHWSRVSLPLPRHSLVTCPGTVFLSSHTPAPPPLGIPSFLSTSASIAMLQASVPGLLSILTP